MVDGDKSRRLIVALDVGGYEEASSLVSALAPHVGYFKVGSVLFTREGPRVCRLIKEAGAKLFLDLKFHDIPNTVTGAVTSALDLDVDMLTLHVSGGEAMLRAAVAAKQSAAREDVVLVGVTVLTHLGLDDFRSLFSSGRGPEDLVLALARTAREAGLDGVVASARELPIIKQAMGAAFKVVTPGIRPAQAAADDQTRVATPSQAIADGADYLVVGRPIIAAADPVAACREILAEMGA